MQLFYFTIISPPSMVLLPVFSGQGYHSVIQCLCLQFFFFFFFNKMRCFSRNMLEPLWQCWSCSSETNYDCWTDRESERESGRQTRLDLISQTKNTDENRGKIFLFEMHFRLLRQRWDALAGALNRRQLSILILLLKFCFCVMIVFSISSLPLQL